MVLTHHMHISNAAKCEIMSAIELYCEINVYSKMHTYMDQHITNTHKKNTIKKQKRRGNSKAQASHSNFSVMLAESS